MALNIDRQIKNEDMQYNGKICPPKPLSGHIVLCPILWDRSLLQMSPQDLDLRCSVSVVLLSISVVDITYYSIRRAS